MFLFQASFLVHRVFDIRDSASSFLFFILHLFVFRGDGNFGTQSVFSANIVVFTLAIKFSFALTHGSLLSFTFHTLFFLSEFRATLAETATSATFTEDQCDRDDQDATYHTHSDYHRFKVQPTDTPSSSTETAETSWWENVFVRIRLTRAVCIAP